MNVSHRRSEHLDVLIVGAGLSGIDAAYRLKTRNPGLSWGLFEARDAIGGTWDLFRYPGVRSDSDMTTLGFPFRPWRGEKAIASGKDIRDYIEDTARAFGIGRRIRFRHKVVSCAWSSADATWRVTYEADGTRREVTCAFLHLCSGYYDYDEGHAPTWPGMEAFGGEIVHPQFWPEACDLSGRSVVVIGSGATAVTLVPALVERGAAHVTMVQRSPTYIVSRPSQDSTGTTLLNRLPARLADAAIRWKNIGYGVLVYTLAKRKPEVVRRKIAAQQRDLLGPDFEMAGHFSPRYDPWDQRLCLVPDADLFEVLRDGRASIVTDTISTFTTGGVELASGRRIDADIVVTATGLKMRLMGGASLSVDGEPVDPSSRLLYRGAMLEGVPNLAFAVGYTNASWTLKCDLTSQLVSRVLDRMRRIGSDTVVPIAPAGSEAQTPMLDLRSGYIERAAGSMPRQGAAAPWKTHQNYLRDLFAFRTGRLDDGALRFERRHARRRRRDAVRSRRQGRGRPSGDVRMTDTMLGTTLDDGIMIVMLDREARLNAFTPATADEPEALLRQVNDDDPVRAVIVTGANQRRPGRPRRHNAGDGFPPGQPLGADRLHVRAAGRRAGGVLELVPAAAGRRADRAGMDAGRRYRRCGYRVEGRAAAIHARDALLAEAEAKALAHRIVDDRSPVAIALTRATIRRNAALPHPIEAHRIESLAMSETSIADGAEGVAAFREKRTPAFTGRASAMPAFFPGTDGRAHDLSRTHCRAAVRARRHRRDRPPGRAARVRACRPVRRRGGPGRDGQAVG